MISQMYKYRFTVVLLFILSFIMTFLSFPLQSKIKKDEKKRIAILNFSANNTFPGIAQIVRNNIEMNLFTTRSFIMLEQSQIEDIVNERNLQISDCADEECAAMFGELLSADYTIIGSVDKLDTFVINVKVVDVKRKRVIIAESREVKDLKEIRGEANDTAERIADRILNLGRRSGLFGKYSLRTNAAFLYLIPCGYLRDLTTGGYAISLTGRIENLFISRFLLGLDLGYIRLKGKDNRTHHASMLPFMLYAGYRYRFWQVDLIPVIECGISYNSVYYYMDSKSSSYAEQGKMQPLTKVSFLCEYKYKTDTYLHFGISYWNSFEKAGNISFISLQAGAGLLF